MIIRSLLVASLCLMATPAFAHVTLEQREAPVGSFYKAVLRVPHGCEKSATVRLRVQIPEGVISVKPMVKPGWTLEVKRGAYARAYSYLHGAKFSEGVREVVWSGGNLPDAFYDEFVISAFIAGELTAGETLYFPVMQECEKGAHHWVAVPSADRPGEKLGDPAPGLKLLQKSKGHGE
ncbi:MAG: DUF1775 domain-containing protein [Pseudolabrys sp.]|nr:DUF1775 domain-containing protein [Pseudolabrys sp.]MDP2297814.1 DUF1775 domain-containing protein [Pseudolabrys sp.]